jgi:general stress protein 26
MPKNYTYERFFTIMGNIMKIFNGSPGFGMPLTDDEIREFLTKSKSNIHVGTLDEKGEPNIHPTWYYFDTANDTFYIETSKMSKKVTNLNRNNIVYYCVDEPNPPYKGVRGKGNVIIHEDIKHNVPIAEKIMINYLGTLENPMAQSLMSAVKKGDSVILEITPNYFSSWDYSRKKG